MECVWQVLSHEQQLANISSGKCTWLLYLSSTSTRVWSLGANKKAWHLIKDSLVSFGKACYRVITLRDGKGSVLANLNKWYSSGGKEEMNVAYSVENNCWSIRASEQIPKEAENSKGMHNRMGIWGKEIAEIGWLQFVQERANWSGHYLADGNRDGEASQCAQWY